MKHFLLLFTAFLIVHLLFAQTNSPQRLRCGTMDAIDKRAALDPVYKAFLAAGKVQFTQSGQITSRTTQQTSSLTEPVIIPVVVHVVMPDPDMISDADIDYFINRLNLDFSGLNPDSANATAFFNVRGHSLLRFARARRAPDGSLTNGIERRKGTIAIGQNIYQPVKHTSAGGLDPWDVNRYYNLWVCGSGVMDVLGIAPGIGRGNATETQVSNTGIDGVVVDYRVFSNNCFADQGYNLARTAIHEIGHNFGLFHTFEGGCSTGDFQQLTTPLCQLPPDLLQPADDTPAEASPNFGCPTGVINSGCASSPSPPGRMYQNYMNYSGDACLTMFTKGQVERMHYLLENCRSGYLNSSLHLPPPGTPTLDAALMNIVNPGGSEFGANECLTSIYPASVCPGNLSPRVRIENRGTTTITSVRLGFSINGVQQPAQTYTVNIAFGNSVVLNLPSINLPRGSHGISIYTSLPNGNADEQPVNDTLSFTIFSGGVSLPVREDFSGNIFPPPGWSDAVVKGTATNALWDRNAATATGAPGSARAALWNITAGNAFDLRSPLISTTGYDSIYVNFSVAHRQYLSTQDTLQLLVATDCGSNFVKIWEQWSSQLSTTSPASNNSQFTSPLPNQWKQVNIELPSQVLPGVLSASSITFAWRAISNKGNHIYLDNINITGKATIIMARDIQPTAIVSPVGRLCGGENIEPQIQVKNKGTDTIKTFTISYRVNNGAVASTNWAGALARDSVAIVKLPVANLQPGNYSLLVRTSQPNNAPDEKPLNDTIQTTFIVEEIYAAPFAEGFESATFPPAGWYITQQPADDTTWMRITSVGSRSMSSVWMNNYFYRSKGRIDILVSPVVKYSDADSVFLRFDLAAATQTQPTSTNVPFDTLEVLLSTDCGLTFTSVYKKWGAQLQTLGEGNFSYPLSFVPVSASQWRRDSVNVSSLLGRSNTFRFAFKVTNQNQNNIFLDNINVRPVVLPARVKSEGYLVAPNPFSNYFIIQHYLPPTNLLAYAVYNSVGQQVAAQSFANGAASSYLQVDMSRMPAGVYTLKLLYADRTITQKMLKVN